MDEHKTKEYMPERPSDPRSWRVIGHNLPHLDACLMGCGRGTALIQYGDGRVRTSAICLTDACDRAMRDSATRGLHNAASLGLISRSTLAAAIQRVHETVAKPLT